MGVIQAARLPDFSDRLVDALGMIAQIALAQADQPAAQRTDEQCLQRQIDRDHLPQQMLPPLDEVEKAR
jgi:hypothetical protein